MGRKKENQYREREVEKKNYQDRRLRDSVSSTVFGSKSNFSGATNSFEFSSHLCSGFSWASRKRTVGLGIQN